MTIAKILCIATATLGLHIASTSPNPPPTDDQRKMSAPTRLEFLLGSYQLRIAQTYLYWILGAIEMIFVIAEFLPLPAWARSALACGGDPTRVQPSATPTLMVGAALITCGAVLRLACYRALGAFFTFELGIIKNHRLVTCGPYAVVRHPSYSGAILAYFGLLLYYGSPGSWVSECLIWGSTAGVVSGIVYAFLMSFVVLGLTGRIPTEDEGLQREFGKEWEDYAAVVRYVLVPHVY